MLDHAMGISLKLLNRLAGSDVVDRLGLRKPAERLLYQGARGGFRVANEATKRFAKSKKSKLDHPERLKPGGEAPKLFDLSLTDEQQMVRDSLERFAEDVLRKHAEAADESSTPPEEVFQGLDELGVRLMGVPEALGGLGGERSPISNMLIIEDLARGDMGLAYAALAPLGVIHALVDWGTAEQQAKYLTSLGEEATVPAAMAVVEPRPLFDPHRLKTRARETGEGWVLTGEKSMVPLIESAELFLIAADVGGEGRLFLVERGAEGMELEREPTMGLRSANLGRIRLDGVRVGPDGLLGGNQSDFDYGALIDRGRIAWAAMAVGACQTVLDYVIPYCNGREAFGEPITNRQAVAFMIADIAIELDGLRMLTYRAASRAEQGLPIKREAYLARLFAAEKGMKIGTDGVQLLGGHGFVKEHPVEMWYRHLRGIGVMEGGLLL